jgi:hypothetical protein
MFSFSGRNSTISHPAPAALKEIAALKLEHPHGQKSPQPAALASSKFRPEVIFLKSTETLARVPKFPVAQTIRDRQNGRRSRPAQSLKRRTQPYRGVLLARFSF